MYITTVNSMLLDCSWHWSLPRTAVDIGRYLELPYGSNRDERVNSAVLWWHKFK